MDTKYIGISLGWRCEAAQLAVKNRIRSTKSEGYMTCPFDLCVTNYIGICKCIEDDFKYFCDTKYLELKKEPLMKEHFGENQTDDQFWIYNTYYNFTFNHESPGHGNLYLTENWENGINHFVDNNFEKFIERYKNRINNFRNYINSDNNFINFVLLRYNDIPYTLENIILEKYPKLNFNIYVAVNYSNEFINLLLNKTIEGAKKFDVSYLEYLNISKDEYKEEYERYSKFIDFNNLKSNRINILYLE
jgi:hypothetical protein